MIRMFSRKVVKLNGPFRLFLAEGGYQGLAEQLSATDKHVRVRAVVEQRVKEKLAEGKDVRTTLTEVFGANLVAQFDKYIDSQKAPPHNLKLKTMQGFEGVFGGEIDEIAKKYKVP
jgi:hypothetical protein